jgi:RCC1 and BTB domain-containing protein
MCHTSYVFSAVALAVQGNKATPTRVEELSSSVITMVTCGWSHTAMLGEDGRVFCCGNGDHGKLGFGDTAKAPVPRVVEELALLNVVRVASYNEHTAVLVRGQRCGSEAESFTKCLRGLVNRREFADIEFLVEGEVVYAHRALLAARCDHFRCGSVLVRVCLPVVSVRICSPRVDADACG